MQTFTFRLGHGWYRRAFDRNPLLRTTDRIESAALLFAIVSLLVVGAIAGALGTAVQDSREQLYAEQQRTRHTVTATATQDSRVETSYGSVVSVATAQWNADGITHTEQFEWPEALKAGQQISIWVDGEGRRSHAAPAPLSQATIDGVMVAVVLMMAVLGTLAGLFHLLRVRLDRRRYAGWDRALEELAGDDSGRTNSQP